MKRNILLISILLIAIPAIVSAGTLFEEDKKASDPFVADRGGFNSMFVNPAGTAGQSGFELAVTAGTETSYNEVMTIVGMTEMAFQMMETAELMDGGAMPGDVPVIESVQEAAQIIADLQATGAVDQALLDAVFAGTDLAGVDWEDAAAVETAATTLASDGTGTQLTNLGNNVAGIMDGTNAAFYAALPDTIDVSVRASVKTGLLIKGFGVGIYDQAMGVAYMDPTTQTYGLETVYNELGVVAGFGFNLFEGKLALGVSGNYGLLMKNENPIALDGISDLVNTTAIRYGYNWGVDLGVIWRPAPSLGIGVVFNDVVGYTQVDTPYTATGLMGLIDDQAYLMDTFDYQVTLDMDAGISWQPDWRFVRPTVGLDLYNVIGYGRAVAANGDTFEEAMYRSLDHIRVGASVKFFDFVSVGAQWYDHYLSFGAGLDLLFLELYGEVKVHESGFSEIVAGNYGDVPLAGDIMVRVHF